MRLLGGRKKLPWHKDAKSLLWPKKGFMRLFNYFAHRIGRLRASPYSISAGLACGIAVSFTPLIGLHILLGIILAWAIRGNVFAGIVGTIIGGNPWTFPFIWLVTYHSGIYFMGGQPSDSDTALPLYGDGLWDILPSLFVNFEEFLVPMLTGCIPFVLFSWVGSFSLCYLTVSKYKVAAEARRRKAAVAKLTARSVDEKTL